MASTGPNPDEPKENKDTDSTGGGRARGGVPTPRLKRGLRGFLIEVQREMKKVSWPTRPETNRLTVVVLSVCLLLVTFLSALGFVFGFVIDIITRGTPR